MQALQREENDPRRKQSKNEWHQKGWEWLFKTKCLVGFKAYVRLKCITTKHKKQTLRREILLELEGQIIIKEVNSVRPNNPKFVYN